MLKYFSSRDIRDFGIHCFGNNTAEIVPYWTSNYATKEWWNTLQYFANTTFNYPTMAEAYRVAALNGLNRLF